ncbi:SpoIID/LytB domain-containing protein [Priestia megaterium]|uniref:SpoIID/LytB domain-containing protein n=1 Tax=Priestia megaterium TaxID=1404 RepID=UPI0016779C4B
MTSLNTFKAQAVAARSYALKHLNDSNLTIHRAGKFMEGNKSYLYTSLDQAVKRRLVK